MSYTLKMFNTGQVTLPKKRRSRFNTDHFIAEEVDWGLLITPIISSQKQQEAVFYENDDGFGVYFAQWKDPEELIQEIQQYTDGR